MNTDRALLNRAYALLTRLNKAEITVSRLEIANFVSEIEDHLDDGAGECDERAAGLPGSLVDQIAQDALDMGKLQAGILPSPKILHADIKAMTSKEAK